MTLKQVQVFIVTLLLSVSSALAQTGENTALKNYQLSYPRVARAYSQFNDVLRKEFEAKGFNYPADQLYLRAFKGDNVLEIWIKNEHADTFSLFKKYNICALSGILGPKRYEGDRQVPEGYYFIADFNPKSDFYLSMLVNYPNYADKVLGYREKLGGDIYIHGGCLTVGCMPMTDELIGELYILCLTAKIKGQTNIPVHIYPVRFDKPGLNFLGREYKEEREKQRFWINLKAGYDYFEKNRKILPVMYNQEGKYIF